MRHQIFQIFPLTFVFVAIISSLADDTQCIINQQILHDCHDGNVYFADASSVSPSIKAFSLNFSVLWGDSHLSTTYQKQTFHLAVNSGRFTYLYTKLTDKPYSKIVHNLLVSTYSGGTRLRRNLNPCLSALEPNSDLDDCYYMMVSEYYVGLRIAPPISSIGGVDCNLCSSNYIDIEVAYNLTSSICAEMSTSTNMSYKNVMEGKSYILYMKSWAIPASPFTFTFQWPLNQKPIVTSFSDQRYVIPKYSSNRAYVTTVFPSTTSLNAYNFFSWQGADTFIGSCVYGKEVVQSTDIAQVILILAITCLVLMIVLVAWSKYAEWRWSGGEQFEWEPEDKTDEILYHAPHHSMHNCAHDKDDVHLSEADGHSKSDIEDRVGGGGGGGGDKNPLHLSRGDMEEVSTIMGHMTSVDIT